jgi:phospholipase/carboxylesterase
MPDRFYLPVTSEIYDISEWIAPIATTASLGKARMTSRLALSFIHRFEPGRDPAAPPLLLLHGTGGDENDLLDLGRAIAPGSALLSPRGKVLEGGMPRFFRRLAEGVFDEADVIRRAAELAEFIGEARALYGLARPVAVGFSNGANIAAAVLVLHPEELAGAVLLRAMVPLSEMPASNLSGKGVMLLSGALDPIVPADNAARLATALRCAGAAVEHTVLAAGHGLSQADVDLIRTWINRRAFAPTESKRS